ncbi:MAG: nitrogen fixation protein NifZ [Thiomonas sp.]|jgi:nitrogen fixation protein NifZ
MPESTTPTWAQSPSTPRYQWGQPVQALVDLCNDGSYPDVGQDALLAPCGAVGEVVRVGQHADSGQTVYLVDFGGRVLGCLESEIGPATTAKTTEQP